MLTKEEFHAWCQRLQISPETEALITRIRSSPPVRKVRGRADNVSGRYPSPKMQCSIQFESQHVEMWGIARAGEHKVEEGKMRSQQQLQELLGKTGKASPTTPNQTRNGRSQVATAPDGSDSPSPRLPKARKIERAPNRDPIGETIHEGNSTKCSFFGLIEVPVRDMRDAGVLKVECPECLATRGLTPQWETVRFPPHDPRKTRTPNREALWARREGWGLAGS